MTNCCPSERHLIKGSNSSNNNIDDDKNNAYDGSKPGSTATLNDEIQLHSHQIYEQEDSPNSSEKMIDNSRFTSILTLADGGGAGDKGDDESKKVEDDESKDKIADAKCDTEKDAAKGEDGDEEPSHGRLLPLPRFLLVYACLSLAVLLTSLDQTVGKWQTGIKENFWQP